MSDPDQEYNEKMQGHLNDAFDKLTLQTGKTGMVYVTTDSGMFTILKEAVSHQYKIERGKI